MQAQEYRMGKGKKSFHCGKTGEDREYFFLDLGPELCLLKSIVSLPTKSDSLGPTDIFTTVYFALKNVT